MTNRGEKGLRERPFFSFTPLKIENNLDKFFNFSAFLEVRKMKTSRRWTLSLHHFLKFRSNSKRISKFFICLQT